jgi:beta-glucanase (GH16 family)
MNNVTITLLAIGLFLIQGCAPEKEANRVSEITTNTQLQTVKEMPVVGSLSAPKLDSNVVWATNVGGQQYQGADGILYLADQFDADTVKGQIDSIKGAQDATIYQTYRSGDMHLQQPLANGTYDIVFRFAEPDDIAVGARIFDVLTEGKVVIADLDVKSARDGNSKSSVDRTVLNVEVNDGILDIQFKLIAGQPLLNGIVVRAKQSADMTQWSLLWNDEFDYAGAPNADKWTHDIWPSGKVNGEEQEYTDALENARVVDGKLLIEAHAKDGKITSARIHSAVKGDIQYGRVEVRARLPEGQGTWPAIWMLPSDPFMYASNCDPNTDWQGNDDCDAWPNSGEIDIMEHVGYDQNMVHGTVHTKAYYWVNGEQRKASIKAPSVSQEFHVYTMQWSAERIDVFLDEVLYFTYLKQTEDWQAWPFDHPFHLILNVAVGGGWGGAGGPTDLKALPTKMEVDYVRVYKRLNALSESN